jgi:hypothetical protein
VKKSFWRIVIVVIPVAITAGSDIHSFLTCSFFRRIHVEISAVKDLTGLKDL